MMQIIFSTSSPLKLKSIGQGNTEASLKPFNPSLQRPDLRSSHMGLHILIDT